MLSRHPARELLPTPLRFFYRDQSMIHAAKTSRAKQSPVGARYIVPPASPRAVPGRSLRVLCAPNSAPSALKPRSSRTHNKPLSRASLKLSCSGRTLDRPVPSPKINPVIPNALLAAGTSAPFRVFCGKNPSSLHNQPPLGFLFSLGGRSFSSDITTSNTGLQPLRNPSSISIQATRSTGTPACVLRSSEFRSGGTLVPCLCPQRAFSAGPPGVFRTLGSLPSETPNHKLPTPDLRPPVQP